MKRLISAVLVISVIGITSANATQMAIWDFGPDANHFTTAPTASNVIGTPTLVLSGGTLDPTGKNGVAYLSDAAGVSHIAGQAGAWDELKVSGNNAKWIVTIDTVGWTDMAVRFDYKAWSTKTTSFDIDYRLNDTDAWTNILNNTPITGGSSGFLASPSYLLPTAINNQSVVELRFNDFDNKGSGKLAFDNFELTGTLVPEPATISLFGLGITAIIRRRRK
jgi:hypothetical protein